jgi:hypothetical protein
MCREQHRARRHTGIGDVVQDISHHYETLPQEEKQTNSQSVHFSGVQYSTVQYNTIQCSAVLAKTTGPSYKNKSQRQQG